jgi:hypothetical protein
LEALGGIQLADEPQPQHIDIGVDDASALFLTARSGWSDQLTGMDGPRLWDRVISSESAL